MTQFKSLLTRVKASRPVRTITHFSESGGAILAGGMTYQAVFAIFAALWVGFSIAGLWLSANPALRDSLYSVINQSIPGLIGPAGVIDPADLASAGVFGWTGAIALVGLLGTTLGWLSTTTQAVRTIFRMERDNTFFVLVKLRELGLGILFGLALIVSALISLASTEALKFLFGLAGIPATSFLFDAGVRSSGLLIVLVIDTVTLAVMFRVLSRVQIPLRPLVTGSLLGAIALGVLKVLGGVLLGGSRSNPLLATFAVIIGLLIWFNLMNTVILVTASWISVGLEDRGIPTTRISAERATAERAASEAAARRIAALAELRDARAAHAAADWRHRWATRRRVKTAERRAAKYEVAGPT